MDNTTAAVHSYSGGYQYPYAADQSRGWGAPCMVGYEPIAPGGPAEVGNLGRAEVSLIQVFTGQPPGGTGSGTGGPWATELTRP